MAIKEDYFDICYKIHSVQQSNCGQTKTFDQICMRYHNMPRRIVEIFIRLCPTCNLKQKQQSQARLQVIRSDNPFDRFKIDLFDMRHNRQEFDSRRYIDKNLSQEAKAKKLKEVKEKREQRYYEWVAHVMCHYTKFHFLWAQETKTMEETADGFDRYLLSYVGLPRILQSDNGSEFRNKVMRNLVTI